MAKIKNVSPFGDLVIPVTGQTIAFGEVVDVPQDVYDSLIEQPLNWAPGDSTTPAAPTPPATTTDAETSSTTPEN